MEQDGQNSESGVPRFVPTDDMPIFLTKAALAAVKEAIAKDGQPDDALRVSVAGGGCAGYQYNLDFERTDRVGDLVISFDGLKVFLDPVSAGYLKGTVIDHVNGNEGAGFKFDNPNPRRRMCGCGSSAA